jgi:hypothetical protein
MKHFARFRQHIVIGVGAVSLGLALPMATAQARSFSWSDPPPSALLQGKAVVDQPVAKTHPEGVVYRYAAFMSHRDYEEAYRLLSPEFQAQLPYADFVARYGSGGETMQILDMVLQPQTSNTERLDYKVLMDRDEATTNSHEQVQEFVLVPPHTGKGPWEIDGISA